MTSAYHCGNCPFQQDRGIGDERCPVTYGDVNGEFPSDVVEGITKIIGCLSHPLARAALREEGAKRERERVLKEFEEVIRLHDVDELLYADLYNEFLKIWKVQSLRGQHGKKD